MCVCMRLRAFACVCVCVCLTRFFCVSLLVRVSVCAFLYVCIAVSIKLELSKSLKKPPRPTHIVLLHPPLVPYHTFPQNPKTPKPHHSLKFFLSLYGHKLPAISLDISSDSTLLISGSADKNIKVSVTHVTHAK